MDEIKNENIKAEITIYS